MTIQNSVERIKPKVLFEFDFGKAEANEDDLLDSCFCNNNSSHEVLSSRKSIVVGEAGAGKTALFKMITSNEHKECFSNPLGKKQLLLPICEDLNYKLIKSRIVPKIKSQLTEPVTLYRYLWELYILYRIALVLKENFSSIPSEVESIIRDVIDAFSTGSSRPTIFELLESNKKTLGLKLESSKIGIPVPEIYFSVEPVSNTILESESKESFVNIDIAKKRINDFLTEQNTVLFVLLDNLDDFVIKDEYETQKQIIEALLICHKNYSPLSSIKLKLFLRSDLYERIDKSALGGLKTHSKSVLMEWNDEDIREFIARRILYNIDKFFKDPHISILVREDELSIYNKGDKIRTPIIIRLIKNIKNLLMTGKFCNPDSLVHYTTRTINLTDKFSRDLITFIFPNKIKHNNINGNEKSIDIFTYLSTHFNLAHGKTTPRIIIIFLDEVLSQAREYLRHNPDQANEYITSTENNEFPLIRKQYISKAYEKLKQKVWDALIDETRNDEWKGYIRILQRKVTGKQEVSFKQLQKMTKCSDTDEMEKFLGYCTHKGLFMCINRGEKKEYTLYKVPILFQYTASN